MSQKKKVGYSLRSGNPGTFDHDEEEKKGSTKRSRSRGQRHAREEGFTGGPDDWFDGKIRGVRPSR